MELYLARGFAVRNLRAVAKKGLAIANESNYSDSQRENWPPGLSFGKAYDLNSLGSFEEIARNSSGSGLVPIVGAIEINSRNLGLLEGGLYWVRRELGLGRYGYEEIDWGLVNSLGDLESGYEFTIVPMHLTSDRMNAMGVKVGILDPKRELFVYSPYEDFCVAVEGRRRWFEF